MKVKLILLWVLASAGSLISAKEALAECNFHGCSQVPGVECNFHGCPIPPNGGECNFHGCPSPTKVEAPPQQQQQQQQYPVMSYPYPVPYPQQTSQPQQSVSDCMNELMYEKVGQSRYRTRISEETAINACTRNR